MEDIELEKYTELVSEISDLKLKIEKYLHSNSNGVEGMTYGQAIKRLAFLRHKVSMTPKVIRERYAESKKEI